MGKARARVGYFTVKEFALICGVSREAVSKWIARGKITAQRFSPAPRAPYYIHESELAKRGVFRNNLK